eukprot:CAMPEP_0185835568 /NCGR_PEP_ID=MMETSP1353-20130828/8049_1 /TAXON_ID=1077150 /ORGANISM="Erythrolobus australicus, Strain CCMP3124" /LENGTH=988 /DNA_ID=CAMNT_0028534227 /DNA_START=1 /DNA_END=2967 /DNA_ORIENTATION=+
MTAAVPYDAGLPVREKLKTLLEAQYYVVRLLDAGMGAAKNAPPDELGEDGGDGGGVDDRAQKMSWARRCAGCVRCGLRDDEAHVRAEAGLEGGVDAEDSAAEAAESARTFGAEGLGKTWRRIPGGKEPVLYSASMLISLADLAVMFRSMFGIRFAIPERRLQALMLELRREERPCESQKPTKTHAVPFSELLEGATDTSAKIEQNSEQPRASVNDALEFNLMSRVAVSVVDIIGLLLLPELACVPGQCEPADAAVDALFRAIARDGEDTFTLADLRAHLCKLRDPHLMRVSESMMRAAVAQSSSPQAADSAAAEELELSRSELRTVLRPAMPELFVAESLELVNFQFVSSKWNITSPVSSAPDAGGDAQRREQSRDVEFGEESASNGTARGSISSTEYLSRYYGCRAMDDKLLCRVRELTAEAKRGSFLTRVPMVDMSTNEMRSATYLALSFFTLIFFLLPTYSIVRAELKPLLYCDDSIWCSTLSSAVAFCIMLVVAFSCGAVMIVPLNTSNSRIASRRWIMFAALLSAAWASGFALIYSQQSYDRRARVSAEQDWKFLLLFCTVSALLIFAVNILFLAERSIASLRERWRRKVRSELHAVHCAASREIDSLLRAALEEHDAQQRSREQHNIFSALGPPPARKASGISRLLDGARESFFALRDVLFARDRLVRDHGLVFPRRFMAAWLCQVAAYLMAVYLGATATSYLIFEASEKTFWRKVLIPAACIASVVSSFNLFAFGAQYVQTVRKLRSGKLNRESGCLRLLRYSSQLWCIGYLEATAFYGQLWPFIIWYLSVALVVASFVWHISRPYAVGLVVGMAGCGLTVALKAVLFDWIGRGTTRRLYRLYPRLFSLFELSEIAYGVVMAGIWSLFRVAYLLGFCSIYIGRLDTTIFSRNIERWDTMHMVYMLAVLNSEAHLHPVITRLASIMLAHMLTGFRNQPHSVNWRALLVQSLIPPLRAHVTCAPLTSNAQLAREHGSASNVHR